MGYVVVSMIGAKFEVGNFSYAKSYTQSLKKMKGLKSLIRSFFAINKWLRYLYVFSIIDIFCVELILKQIENKYDILVNLGNILLIFCYAFATAFIFYFITVFLNYDSKRLSIYRILNKKTQKIKNEITDIFQTLFYYANLNIDYNDNTTLKTIKLALNNINVNRKIVSYYDQFEFDDIYKFLYFRKGKIKTLIIEILLLTDYLDDDYREYITYIEDMIMDDLVFSGIQKIGVTNLEFADNIFQQLHNYSIDIIDSLEKANERYRIEYLEKGKRYRQQKGWE